MRFSTLSTSQPKIPLSRHYWFWGLALLGCAADLLSKQMVFNHPKLSRGSEWWLWEGHLGVQKSLNEGALFGLGQGKVSLFALFAALAVLAIPVWLFVFRGAVDKRLTIILGCITGGVLGNLYDRIGLHGLLWDQFQPSRVGESVHAVRDWILVQWNDNWVWPNFNIADALLVCGACALFLQSFVANSEKSNSAIDSDNAADHS